MAWASNVELIGLRNINMLYSSGIHSCYLWIWKWRFYHYHLINQSTRPHLCFVQPNCLRSIFLRCKIRWGLMEQVIFISCFLCAVLKYQLWWIQSLSGCGILNVSKGPMFNFYKYFITWPCNCTTLFNLLSILRSFGYLLLFRVSD